MKFLRQLTAFFLTSCSVLVFPVAAEEMDHSTMDHNQMEVQQHGTTLMHTSPSDENDMSHTMHESPVSKAATKKVPPGASDQHNPPLPPRNGSMNGAMICPMPSASRGSPSRGPRNNPG